MSLQWIPDNPVTPLSPVAIDMSVRDAVEKRLRNFYGPLRGVFLGHSITAGDSDIIGNIHNVNTVAPVLQSLCGGTINIAKNSGIPGITSQNLVQRFGLDVARYKPGLVFIETGTNDYNTDGTLVAALGGVHTNVSMRELIRATLSIDALPIVLSILPSGSAARAAAYKAQNAIIKAFCATLGVPYADSHAVLANESGGWADLANANYDNGGYVHPSPQGVRVIAGVVHSTISARLPSWPRLPALRSYINGASDDGGNAIGNGANLPVTAGDTGAALAGGLAYGGGIARTYTRVDDGRINGIWQYISWAQGSPTGPTILQSTGINLTHRLRSKRVSFRCRTDLSAGNYAAGNSFDVKITFQDRTGTAIAGGASRCYVNNDGLGYIQIEASCPAQAWRVEVQYSANVNSTAAAGNMGFGDISLTEVPDVPFAAGSFRSRDPAPVRDIRSTDAATYTATIEDEIITVDASSEPVTITLPSATFAIAGFNPLYGTRLCTAGMSVQVKKVDASANTVTVQRAGTDTIEGATSVVLAAQWDGVTVKSRGNGTWIKG